MAVVITEQDIYTTASTWPRERLEALVEGLKNTLKSMKVVREESTKKALQFPRIPKDLKMSQAVKDMVFWDFPKDIDIDKELENMWEERAK